MTAPGVSSWDDMVATATVGTDTRRLDLSGAPDLLAGPLSGLSDAFPAAQLLDAAAVFTVARRSGQLPAAAPDPMLPPAGPDDSRALTADAARILMLLGQRSAVLLTDALDDVATAGYRLPAPLLADYLAAGTRSLDLRRYLEPVLGRRGRWLAAQNPAWRWVGDAVEVSDDPEIWRTGSPPQRRAWLSAARRNDPAAARELLRTGWNAEKPEDRAPLLGLLRSDLVDTDEPFLEQALDDRRADVRDTARALLARLPGSELNRRRSERAARAVQVEQRLLRRRLRVELPAACDPTMVRDGIVPTPPANAGLGERHHWFREVVAAAPLAGWPLPASDMLSLAAVDRDGADVTAELVQGLTAAAVRQQNPDWARVLLASRTAAKDVPGLLAALPAPERFDLITTWLTRSDLALLNLVGDVRPWPPSLAVEVVHQLRQQRPVEQGPILGTLPLIARRLPAERTTQLDVAAALSDLATNLLADSRWRRALTEAAEIVMLRRRLLEELR